MLNWYKIETDCFRVHFSIFYIHFMTESKKPPDYLANLNPHERDPYIEFDEGPHIYTVRGEGGYTSVTTWIHEIFPHFDSYKVIDASISRAGKDWNVKEKNKKYWHQTENRPMTREEIKQTWSENALTSSTAGTKLHYDIECYYNKVPTTNTSIEYEYFKKYLVDFEKEHPYLIPYRTEWMVYYEDVKLSGSIDMIYQDTRDTTGTTLVIYDWKRCKEIVYDDDYGNPGGSIPPVEDLPNVNFWHYTMQLNIYKKILEDKYGKKITKLALVALHPDHRNYEIHDVDIMEERINALFEYRKNNMTKK
jgi:hypothetical protein